MTLRLWLLLLVLFAGEITNPILLAKQAGLRNMPLAPSRGDR